MPIPSTVQVTNLLLTWGHGDERAFEQLVPVVHAELRRIARRQMGHERVGHTLQPTALVNEAYLKLIDIRQFSSDGRWLAYVSNQSGRSEVYVQPCPGPGERHLISTNGGLQPAWGGNQELFYRRRRDVRYRETHVGQHPDGPGIFGRDTRNPVREQ